MKYVALLCLVAFAFAQETEKQAYQVWDASCIVSISKGIHTRMEAPLRSGKPDMSEVKILGIHAEYVSGCGHIEIRKEK